MAKRATTSSRNIDTYVNTVGISKAIPSTAGQANEKVSSAYSSKDRVGMIIHEVEYTFSLLQALFDSAGDGIRFGLSVASVQSDTGNAVSDAGVMDFNIISRFDIGTAAIGEIRDHTVVRKNFSTYPGGGLLVHPAFLYVWIYTQATLGTTADLYTRIRYTVTALSDSDYMDLWQNMILLTTV